jgi:hypothetical protein
MCNPLAVQAVVAVAGMVMQGKAQEDQANYQAGVNRYNARKSENEAQLERDKATEAENLQRRKSAEFVAKQRAQLAAQGVDVGSGSALQLQEDTATLGEIDALRIRNTGNQRFAALTGEADLQESNADANVVAGRNAMTGSLLSAAGSVAGSGVADSWFSSNSAAMNPSLTNNTAYVKQF